MLAAVCMLAPSDAAFAKSSKTVPVKQYVRALCGSLKKLADADAKLKTSFTVTAGKTTDMATYRDATVSYLGSAADAETTFVTKLKEAKVPNVKGGRRSLRNWQPMLNSVLHHRSAYLLLAAKSKVATLSTTDATKFKADLATAVSSAQPPSGPLDNVKRRHLESEAEHDDRAGGAWRERACAALSSAGFLVTERSARAPACARTVDDRGAAEQAGDDVLGAGVGGVGALALRRSASRRLRARTRA